MKKRIAVLMSIFVFFVAFAGQALAADVASAKITRVGTNPATGPASGYFVALDDLASPGAWTGSQAFYLSTDLGDSGLATLLTAYSLGKTVWVRTLGTVPGSIITVIYMND